MAPFVGFASIKLVPSLRKDLPALKASNGAVDIFYTLLWRYVSRRGCMYVSECLEREDA